MLLLRRLRGIGIAAIVWSLLWLAFGIGAAIYRYARLRPYDAMFFDGHHFSLSKPPMLPFIGVQVGLWVVWGAVVGIVFAISLVTAERNQPLAEIPMVRFAAWGAYAAMLLPGMFFIVELKNMGVPLRDMALSIDRQVAVDLLSTGIFGALCAAGMLRLARRQPST